MEKSNQKKQMEELYCVAREVVKCWWVILLIAISVSFLAYIATSLRYQPTYTSKTTFVVSAKENSTGAYASVSQTERLTEVFRSVMDSTILKKKVAEELGMKSFPGTVQISVVTDTNLLTVSVTSGSPELSLRLLKKMMEYYPEVSRNVLGEVVLEVFQEPKFPSGVDNPYDGNSIMKKAFLLAALAVTFILAVFAYLKDTVKTEEDIHNKVDAACFGQLRHENPYRDIKAFFNNKRKKMILNAPSMSFEFVETVKKLRTKLLYQCAKTGSKVIYVTSTLKKEGKTTVAANLAMSMAMRGKNVLLIEGDLRKVALADYFGVKIPYELEKKEVLDAGVDLYSHVFGLRGTSLYLWVNDSPHAKTTEFLLSNQMTEFLEKMREQMDYIIIDGPCVKGRADAEVWASRADVSLLVVKQNLAMIPFINDSVDTLNKYGHGVLGCILNNVYRGNAIISSGYGYGYGYGSYYGGNYYGKYGRYGKYGKKTVESGEMKNE